MRILHIIRKLAAGGAERQCCLLAEAQQDAGHDVHIGFGETAPIADRLIARGVQLHRVESRSNLSPYLIFQTAALIRRTRPDVVQTWLTQMDVIGGLAATLCGVPWVVAERASAPCYPQSTRTFLRLRVAHYAAAIVANSNQGARYWRSRASTSLLQCVIPNAVPFAEIAVARPSHSDVLASPTILCASRLSPEKNFGVLIPALCQVLEATPAIAVVCGEGPDASQISARVGELNLGDRITIAGRCENLWPRMKAAAAFVSISHFEGCPNSVLEAIACGCPVVLSDIPEHRELVDEQCAWFVDRTDPAAVAAAIQDVLARPDEALRRSAAARAAIAPYTLQECVRRYDDVYTSIANHRRAVTKSAGS